MTTSDWPASFPRADVVLVVPPFAPTFQPSIACHQLQACARQRGHDVIIVYGNLLFASIVGHGAYERMLERGLSLEHIFKDAAFGPSIDASSDIEPSLMDGVRAVEPWLRRLGKVVRSIAPKVVGATCSFEQITSSVALLNRCKEIDPQITTIIGGANCEGEMAQGMLSLRARIDHVFSSESESSFPAFLEQVLCGGIVTDRVIEGSPCTTLDDLPLPAYHEYFDQCAVYLGEDHHPSTSAPCHTRAAVVVGGVRSITARSAVSTGCRSGSGRRRPNVSPPTFGCCWTTTR